MEVLDDAIGNAGDYDRFLLFLDFEDIDSNDLFGSVNRPTAQPAVAAHVIPHLAAHVIPYLKAKLIWS